MIRRFQRECRAGSRSSQEGSSANAAEFGTNPGPIASDRDGSALEVSLDVVLEPAAADDASEPVDDLTVRTDEVGGRRCGYSVLDAGLT